jgi:hypothetical protein
MRLHLSSLRALQRGDPEEAGRCDAQLQAAIHQHEREGREGAAARDAEEQRRRRRQQDSGAGGAGGDQRGPGRQFW